MDGPPTSIADTESTAPDETPVEATRADGAALIDRAWYNRAAT